MAMNSLVSSPLRRSEPGTRWSPRRRGRPWALQRSIRWGLAARNTSAKAAIRSSACSGVSSAASRTKVAVRAKYSGIIEETSRSWSIAWAL
jgi:hypothetical protein